MSSFVTVAQAIKEIENWLRLATLLHKPLKEALLAILHNDYNHNYVGLPRNPAALNTALRNQQNSINKLTKQKVLNKDQVDILLPKNSNQTESQSFDLTLIIVLIINFTTLPPPQNGWRRNPSLNDLSIAAFVLLAREWRNRLLHADAKMINLKELNMRWTEGEQIVCGLGLVNYNFNALRNRPLDVTNNVVVQSLSFFSKKILNDLKTVQTDNAQMKIDVPNNAAELLKNKITLAVHDASLANHDTALTDQGTALADQGTALTDHGTVLAAHGTALADHKATLADQSTALDDHNIVLADHDTTLADHDQSLLNFFQVVGRLENEHEFIKATLPKHTETESCCLQQVLDYILQQIGSQKTQLFSRLGICDSNKENMIDALKNIKWWRLSLELERLGRMDIVKHVTENTLITEDIQIASSKLRCQYAENVITSLVNEPLLRDHSELHYQYDENLYTDLAVLKATEVEKEINNSDRESLMEQRLLEKESIEMSDLFQSSDEAVFVRAVGGMGKTTMLEMYARKVSKRELDLDFPVEFVFFFSCREINRLYGDIKSIDELFKYKYPEVFEIISLKDLEPISDKILIIVDGLDELQDVYADCSKKTNKKSLSPFQIVFDLINTKGQILKGHKSIASGRPKACDFVRKQILDLRDTERRIIKIKTVEVCGFKEVDVGKYIEKFFNGNDAKVKRVKEVISLSDNLKVMATVPVFTWVICNVYSEDLITKPLNTCTELYMYACLVFLRKHLQGVKSGSYNTLTEMLDDDNVIECIYSLMTLSVKTYMRNKVLFSEKDIRKLNCPVHLEQTGLIVKYSRVKIGKPIYQYKHLVLQEFLTGLYLCVTKGISPYLTNRELISCAPVIFGINRLLKENELHSQFFTRLSQLHTIKSKLFKRFTQPYRAWAFRRYLSMNSLEIPNCMLGLDSLIIDPSIPECQQFMTLFYEARLKFECPFSTVKFKTFDINRIDLRNAIFLIEHLNLKVRIPECMVGYNSLIIDTSKPECKGFIDFLYDSKVKVECPYSTIEIRSDLQKYEWKFTFLMEHLNLTLAIPECMIGLDSLILDVYNPEYKRFIDFVFGSKFKVESPFSTVEIHSYLQRYDETVTFLIKHLNLTPVIPDCMMGSDSLIIDTSKPECNGFIDFLYHSKVKVECPYSTVEIRSYIQGHELEIVFLIKNLNLTPSIPECMIGSDSLIVNVYKPECRWWIDFLYDSKVKVECPFFTVEIHSNILGYEEQVIFLMKHLNLTPVIPECMIGSDSLIIDMNKPECKGFIAILYDSEVKVECPFSTVEIHGDIQFYIQKLTFLAKHLNLPPVIPECMVGSDSLIIDMNRPECKGFIDLLYKSMVKVEFQHSDVTVIGTLSKYDAKVLHFIELVTTLIP